MTAKIGRPKSDNPKNRKVTVKMTEAEFQNLEEVSSSLKLTKSQTILKGIDLLKSKN